ncbi:MAG: PucR family transcriptional regulator ligand-binding domain-containing protein [Eubacterium sp.]|nr:PucR family transcriptional regulator ligand-binding domain-containing protein [Eubacterium sp.]
MVYVKDLLQLESFKKFTLVSGSNGLNRSVSWPNIAQTTSISQWLVGGDVILMTGVGLDITEEFLKKIVVEAADGQAACIVMLIHPEHIKEIPATVIKEANKRKISLFTAPWETKLFEVIGSISMLVANDRLEERMHNEFFEKLLIGELDFNDPMYEKYFEKYKLFDRKIIISINYQFDGKKLKNKKDAYYSERIMTQMLQLFITNFQGINYLNKYKKQTLIISSLHQTEEEVIAIVNNIFSKFKLENREVTLKIGIGEITKEIPQQDYYSGETGKMKQKTLQLQVKELSKSYQQASIARKTLEAEGVVSYRELGIFQLLFFIDDKERIREYVNGYLAPVVEYDKYNNQNLLETLREYLKSGANVSKAAQTLYIHRNTMIKRIEKIEELLNISLKNPDTYNEIYNAVRIYKMFL